MAKIGKIIQNPGGTLDFKLKMRLFGQLLPRFHENYPKIWGFWIIEGRFEGKLSKMCVMSTISGA
ncbi:MAG: hypothetical protein Q4F28_03645 [Eubacteriales bacterium]|nr:hypothetical protein [Eubacteriales bacterium]